MEELKENIKDEIKKAKRIKGEKIFLLVISIIILIRMIIFCIYIYSPSSVSEDKPVIYLYPEETIEVSVKLGNAEKITCSYPKYDEKGWKVTAEPSGKLTDLNTGRELYCLYWEGKDTNKSNINEGFVVKGEDTIKFLEEKLEILGLNQKEAEEFIIYWLPQMEDNKYNYIRFETIEEINNNMPLKITPTPDTVIRINMEWKALDEYIEVEEQILEKALTRTGFTVVEWGRNKT